MTRALKSLKICTFIGSCCAKYLMFDLKKVQRSYLSWHWRVIQNLERNWLVVSKLTWGIWQILTWTLESLKNFPFSGLLLSKVYIVRAKKVQRSYLSWQWRVMQNLKRNWLVVSKLTREIWQILTWALESLRNFQFNRLLLSKVYIVPAKKVKRSYLSWHWRVMQNLKRNWLVISKLTWGIWRILTRALESLKNFHFNRLLLSKVYIVWTKILQRSYLSWYCRVTQNLKKNWPVVWKMTWAIWQIFTRALKSVKIGTLMGSFCLKQKMYQLKISRRVMCHGNEEWYKNWRGIDLSLSNWHEEFDKFWPEHLKG